MEEAQHLADRVAILRAGRIVALGRPDELAGDNAEATVDTFRRPAIDLDGLGARLDARVELVGEDVAVRTADAQVTLGRLLAWAEEHALRLERLEVRRPDLEEIFLGLVAGAEPDGDGTGGG
jgi:ABC-2 type transport system ATP-binding protein